MVVVVVINTRQQGRMYNGLSARGVTGLLWVVTL